MACSVWKYELPIGDNVIIQMKAGAQILDVAEQNSSLYLWAMVCVDNKDEERHFRIVGTGHPIKTEIGLRYIGTVHNFMDTGCVFHVFHKE